MDQEKEDNYLVKHFKENVAKNKKTMKMLGHRFPEDDVKKDK